MTPRGYVQPPRHLSSMEFGRVTGEIQFARNLVEAAGEGKASECWEWPTAINHAGYGVSGSRQRVMAHRAVYERMIGPIPDGLQLDHLCRNRRCVNPWHLEPVTCAENNRRGMKAQQTECKYGHEFTPENTIRKANGTRQCRECTNAKQRRAYWAKKGRLAS